MAAASLKRFALAAALAVSAGPLAYAQHQHGGHGAGHGGGHAGHHGAGQQQGATDMERMRGMMRQMMGMMDRMQSASPADRERMMNEMRPMMQSIMPMMQGMMGGEHKNHGGQPSGQTASDSTRAYEEANAKMHRDMAISFSGNADVDFVRGMIPHHQGAIDMAQVVLKFGKDDWVKKLAQEVIAAQTREIAEMRDWLSRNPR